MAHHCKTCSLIFLLQHLTDKTNWSLAVLHHWQPSGVWKPLLQFTGSAVSPQPAVFFLARFLRLRPTLANPPSICFGATRPTLDQP